MMRIAEVFYEPIHSGQAVHVLSLAAHLDRRQCALHVCYPAGDEHTRRRLAELGVPGHPWPMRKWHNAGPALALLRLIRREKIDVVHVHGQFAGIWVRPAARLAGAGVVYTPHTIRIRQAALQPAYEILERAWRRFTDIVIAVCEADRRRIIGKGWGMIESVRTVYNGLDWEEWQSRQVPKETARGQLGWPPAVPVILQVGRLDAQKAPEDFVHMMRWLHAHLPEARGFLAGDGPLRPRVQEMVRECGLDGVVALLGQRQDIPVLLSAADVVTLTSRWEGLPYSLLEAGAVARPAVATAVNGVPEVILHGVTGFVVPAGQPETMAEAVRTLLTDPSRACAMGLAAQQRVREIFDVRRTAEEVMGIYQEVIQRRGRTQPVRGKCRSR
ncbi:MAG: glycosyltransferase [Anaerolineae bacterium]